MSAKWYKERLDDVGKTINRESENEKIIIRNCNFRIDRKLCKMGRQSKRLEKRYKWIKKNCKSLYSRRKTLKRIQRDDKSKGFG